MTTEALALAMNRELRDADPNLVGNDDLLRGVLSGCGDCIKVLDLEGRLQFMSDGGKRVMEVEDFSLLKGCPWPSFWLGAGNQQAIDAVNAAKAGKTARFRGPANTAKGTPKYWDVQIAPIFGANGEVSQLLSISKDITEEWEAAQRERFLIEELEHRAKNSFAMVLAIAAQTFRGDANSSPLKTYQGRIMALAKAHEIANKSNRGDVQVASVVEAALAPHRTDDGRFSVTGPAVSVNPRQALALTLAVNELATNAAKYGALSSPSGRIDISWSASHNGSPMFVFGWRERGGPHVVAPKRQGFGSRVIQDFMAADFGGTVRMSFEQSGVVCELIAPLENLPS